MTFKIVGMALSETVGQMIIIENQQKYAFIRNTLGCCLAIGLNYWIIPIHGIIGASIISIVVTLFVGSIANLIIPSYHRYFKIQVKALFIGWKDIFNLRYIKI
jgi:O-antigen/teichoic acid export membrane protein